MIIGGGLAGLSAAMKLAEIGVSVDLMSLTPVKRSHSVCAQGGINSVNDQTRQAGDNEWKHFDDTVYGGDFLQHQPPVKEMADWAPKIIDLMDRLGVDRVDRIRLAGAFGSHIDVKYAMVLGMIPDCPLEKVASAGNAAGTGGNGGAGGAGVPKMFSKM